MYVHKLRLRSDLVSVPTDQPKAALARLAAHIVYGSRRSWCDASFGASSSCVSLRQLTGAIRHLIPHKQSIHIPTFFKRSYVANFPKMTGSQEQRGKPNEGEACG
jgi:hypothetical protein